MVDLKRILRDVAQTAIFVTHDQSEALALADVVAIMDQGRLLQIDRPERVYRQPAGETAARFLGLTNILDGELVSNSRAATAVGELTLDPPAENASGRVKVLIPPDAARPAQDHETPDLTGRILDRLFRGRFYFVHVRTGDATLSFDLPADASPPHPGETVHLVLTRKAVLI
jgi:ABC-type Fe3+/spermidine/putrescine transport system ATPase subunit